MDVLQHQKAIVTFEQGILWIKFNTGIDIEVKDIQEIYNFGTEKSKGLPYCVLFDSAGTFDLREEVVEFVADNASSAPIKAKAYVVQPGDQMTKARLHLAFDRPKVRPGIFASKKEAVNWLQSAMKI
jgi:hypothetical protein